MRYTGRRPVERFARISFRQRLKFPAPILVLVKHNNRERTRACFGLDPINFPLRCHHFAMTTSDSHNALLAKVAATPLEDAIQTDLLTSTLSKPPFVTLPGALNLRDVGALMPEYIAPGKVFRSGTLDFIPPPSRPLLRSQFGVSRVYDFRREDEVKSGRLEIDGIQVLACPYKDGTEKPLPVLIPDFAPAEDGAVGQGFRKMYDNVLSGYTTGFRSVLEGVQSAGEGEAVLYHCTGKL